MTRTNRAPRIALKRVSTLARKISPSERDVRSSRRLTSPRLVRSATSPLVRPVSRVVVPGADVVTGSV